jgi:hypothetical protein
MDSPFAADDVIHFGVGVTAGLIFRFNRSVSCMIVGVFVIYQTVEYAYRKDTILKDLSIFALGFALAYLLAGEVK